MPVVFHRTGHCRSATGREDSARTLGSGGQRTRRAAVPHASQGAARRVESHRPGSGGSRPCLHSACGTHRLSCQERGREGERAAPCRSSVQYAGCPIRCVLDFNCLQDVLRAVSYLHSLNIVHRCRCSASCSAHGWLRCLARLGTPGPLCAHAQRREAANSMPCTA